MLPADKSTHSSRWSIDRSEPLGVPSTPNEPFRIGWHELAVMVEKPTVRPERKEGVVKRSPTGASLNDLTDP